MNLNFTGSGMMLLLVFAMEFVALCYQYALGYDPCVLCIHIRLWLAAIFVTCLMSKLMPGRALRTACAVLNAGWFTGMVYTSYQLLATERGWEFISLFNKFSSCGLDLGLPGPLAHLKFDEWLPFMFKPLEACGYTPELILGITFAEALMVISVSFLWIHLIALLLMWLPSLPKVIQAESTTL